MSSLAGTNKQKCTWNLQRKAQRHNLKPPGLQFKTNLGIEKVQISGGGAQTCKKVSVICKKSPVLAGDMEICEYDEGTLGNICGNIQRSKRYICIKKQIQFYWEKRYNRTQKSGLWVCKLNMWSTFQLYIMIYWCSRKNKCFKIMERRSFLTIKVVNVSHQLLS